MRMKMLRAVAVPGVLGLLAGTGIAVGPAAGAAVPGCTVINPAGNHRYTNLQDAVSAAGGRAILFVAGTCTGNTVVGQNQAQNLAITGLFGPGRATLNLPAGDLSTVLTVGSGTVTLNGLTITGGGGGGPEAGDYGGGIINDGTLTLDNTAVTGNTASLGGGIWNDGTLALDGRSTVTGNTAGFGGGIWNDGSLIIDGQVSVTGNTAYAGGGIYIDSGTLTLDGQSSVSHNTASGEDAEGGGILNDGMVTIGGQASVSHNTASGEDAYGGGIGNDYSATVTISGLASVNRNTASGQGGGIWNGGALSVLEDATVSFNNADSGTDSGGGIYSNNPVPTAHAGFGGNVFGNKPDDIVS